MSEQELLMVMTKMVRVGKVSSVDKPARTAKVIFSDRCTEFVSGDLVVLRNFAHIPYKDVPQRTEYEEGGGGDAAYASHKHDLIITPWLPDVGENVLCIYLASEHGDGYVIGGV